MKLEIASPVEAYLNATTQELEELREQLSYTNKANQHMLKRHYANHWARRKDEQAWEAQKKILQDSIHNTLIWDHEGIDFIRPGSIPYLIDINLEIDSKIKYPEPKKIAWEKPLPFELYPYQETSWVELLKVRHGNVELCTGAGKSAILLKLCRETGFKTAIIAPSQSIFLELLEKFEYHFGRGNVGAFGDGKKKLGKRFTICIGDSIKNIKPETEEWEFFSKLDMLCVDESHTWGADTLEEICHGVLSDIPYRFFFSGTQTRGDGTEKLLQSIIGKTVCTLTTKEAREKGYICDHDFNIVEVESSNPNFQSSDPIEQKRIHFLGNRNICAFIAKLANAEATLARRQTLVLVEELSQIANLLPLLKVPTAIAHSEKNPKRLQQLGLEKVDRKESVEKFNKAEAMVLIGTSCISTGTNIYPTHHTFNWQGGASEIKTKQGAVGRSVRLHSHNPWKDRCTLKTISHIWDFCVVDNFTNIRHLEERTAYYNESGSQIKRIKIKK